MLLVFGFGSLMALALALILWLGVQTTRHNTEGLLSALLDSLMQHVVSRMDDQLGPVSAQLEYLATKLDSLEFQQLSDQEQSLFFQGTLAGAPQVCHVGYLQLDGMNLFLDRSLDRQRMGNLLTDEARDVLLGHPWKPGQQYWAAPSLLRGRDRPVVPLVRPIFSGDALQGLLIALVDLGAVQQHLARMLSDSTHFSLFLARDQQLMAVAEQGFAGRAVLPAQLDLTGSPLAVVFRGQALATEPRAGDAYRVARLEYRDQPYLLALSPLAVTGTESWQVGVLISDQAVRTERDRITRLLLLGGLLLLLFLGLALWFGTRLADGFSRMATAFRLIREQGVEVELNFPRSRISEFIEAAQACQHMLDSLREHDRVRRLFGQYVPEAVALQLVRGGGQLAPQQTRATVLFIDIEGFTALAERIAPDQLVRVLNGYFNRVTAILEAHYGVVTQYQGDAILATFNVPVPQPDHAGHAVRAAREILAALADEQFEGLSIRARIGINTGALIAASVGAQDRLNYTVHGDAVNLAARLEAMNKQQGTRLLVAEATVAACPDERWVHLTTTEVRGRQEPVAVYTLDELWSGSAGSA